MGLSIEEKYDEVRQLITMGKEKGYLLYEEVNDMLPSELSSSDELDDIFSMFGSMGIEVVDSEQKYREKAEGEEGAELDLTPGTLDKTNDPVRMYLREMGTVPLLTREGEVEIAKRIERGKKAVMRVISRSPMAAHEVLRLGERLAGREINVRDFVVFNEEEITEEKLEAKIRQTLKLTDKVREAHEEYLTYRKHFLKLERKSRGYVKGKWRLGRLRIAVSQRHPPLRVRGAREAPPLRAGAREHRAHPRTPSCRSRASTPSSRPSSATSTRSRSGCRSASRRTTWSRSRRSSTPGPTSSSTPWSASSRARWRRRRPRRSWWRPTSAWWSPSPRSTRTAACSSWTSSRRATSAS